MNTALCISGELRRLPLFFPIIDKHILQPYAPDIFVSTWNMPHDAVTSVGNTVRDKLDISSIEEMCKLYNPTGLYVQKYSSQIKTYLTGIGKTNNDNLLCMAFNIHKSILLANDRALLTNKPYDLIVRYRFDYGVKNIKFENYDLNKINIPNEHGYNGYQDQFAFGNQQAMYTYANWVFQIAVNENAFAKERDLSTNRHTHPGFPWHPESSLKRYLDTSQISVNLIDGLSIVYPWCSETEIGELYD